MIRNKLASFALPLLAFTALALPARSQTITASPTSLNFYHQVGLGSSPQQTVNLSFSSQIITTVTLTFSGQTGWLFVSSTGQQPASTGYSLTVIPTVPTSFPVGVYQAQITISASGIASVVVPVTLTVSNQPLLIANKTGLEYVFATGGTAPGSQTLDITSTTPGIPFTAAASTTSGGPWLAVTPASATTAAQLTVSVNVAGLAVGTYSGEVAVAAAGAGNTVRVPVTLRVISALQLSATPASLQFDFQVGGATPPDQILSIATSGIAIPVGAVATTTSGGNWLAVQPGSGNSPINMTVSVVPGGLTPGTYNGKITITATGATGSPMDVPVTLRVSNDPVLRANPATLVFTYQTNGPLPAAQSTVVSNGTTAAIPVTATVTTLSGGAWLSVTPLSANTPLGLVVSVNPTGMVPGVYSGTVTVAGSGAGSSTPVAVVLVVSASPVLRLSESYLSFAYTINSGLPAALPITVTTTGATASTFGMSVSPSWVSVTPTAATTPATVQVSVNPAGLNPGVHNGIISFASTEAGSTTISIPVQLTVSASPLIRTQTRPFRFNFSSGGSLPDNQALQIDSSGGAFNYSATPVSHSDPTWLAVGPSGGPSGTSIAVGAGNANRLAQGTHGGVVVVEAPGTGNSPQFVPAMLTVSTAVDLSVNPGTLAFDFTPGAAAPAAQILSVSAPNTVLNYTAAAETLSGGQWLSVTPTGGLSPATLSVTVNPQGLAAGIYSGFIRVSAPQAANSPRLIQVTLTVRQAAPTLAVSRDSVSFAFTPGSPVPAAQQVQVTSTGDAVTFSGTVSTATGGQWLSAASSGASTPATLTISVNPAGLAAGTYSGTVTVASTTNAANARTINITLTVAAIPAPQLTTFVHAASFAPSGAIPGMLFTIAGTNLGPAAPLTTQLDPRGNVESTLGGTRVLFDGLAAPLIYVSPTQINGVVPYGVAGRASTRVTVTYQGVTSSSLELRVADTNPGIFMLNQAGQGAILNASDGNSINGAGRPAARGGIIVIYATGEGQTSPFGVDGTVPGVNAPLRRPLADVRVEIGGVAARVDYAGSAPQFVSGVLQINAVVPESAPVGPSVPIRVTIGSVTSPANVTVAVR
jgi:uncharacterized protein (TIGR03437 family)